MVERIMEIALALHVVLIFALGPLFAMALAYFTAIQVYAVLPVQAAWIALLMYFFCVWGTMKWYQRQSM